MYNGIFERIDSIRANPVRLRHCTEPRCLGEKDTEQEYYWSYHAQAFLCPECWKKIDEQMKEYQRWVREKAKRKKRDV